MHIASLLSWELAVALSIFGWGFAGLWTLRIRNRSLALAGSFGVSLLLAIGGVMNLLHLLTTTFIWIFVVAGILFSLLAILLRSYSSLSAPGAEKRAPFFSNLILGIGIVVVLLLMFGALNPLAWTGDDLQAYTAYATKALQNHSLQPDPFSERRINTGLGGAIFLDSFMFATGDFRAMVFIDACFGLLLYALSFWTIGRMWKVPPGIVGLCLICIPLATVMQVNLTIVYLSAAGFLAIVIVFTDTSLGEQFTLGKVAAVGIITGALLVTKTSNIIFVVPFVVLIPLLYRIFNPRARILLPTAASLLLAILVAIPWSIAQKENEGTFLFPLLGHGFHASAYRILPAPAEVSSHTNAIALAIPGILIVLGCFTLVWKLTKRWPAWTRASILSFSAAALVAIPVTSAGVGGEGLDRYTAPFVMPLMLLLLFLLFHRVNDASLHRWRQAGKIALGLMFFYVIVFLGIAARWYVQEKLLLYQLADRLPRPGVRYRFPADLNHFQEEQRRDALSQASLPPGATALEVIQSPFGFDYRRNKIYICDYCGMASLPPGMPVDQGSPALRQYLVNAGISYIIYDLRREDDFPNWQEYTQHPYLRWSYKEHLSHPVTSHLMQPWGRMEIYVNAHVRDQLYEIVTNSPEVYNDGTLVVAKIQ